MGNFSPDRKSCRITNLANLAGSESCWFANLADTQNLQTRWSASEECAGESPLESSHFERIFREGFWEFLKEIF
jgi:hypothetical protein